MSPPRKDNVWHARTCRWRYACICTFKPRIYLISDHVKILKEYFLPKIQETVGDTAINKRGYEKRQRVECLPLSAISGVFLKLIADTSHYTCLMWNAHVCIQLRTFSNFLREKKGGATLFWTSIIMAFTCNIYLTADGVYKRREN